MSEKTEKPSAKKLREAKEKGQIAKSRLLGAAGATFGGLVGLSAGAPAGAASLHGWTVRLFSHPELGARSALLQGLGILSAFAVPVLCGAFAGSLGAAVLMAGLQFQPSLVAPQLSRVSPGAGFKKLFSGKQALEMVKALGVAAIVLALVWSAVRSAGPEALRATRLDGGAAFRVLIHRLWPVLWRAGFTLLALGGLDYLWARHRHQKDLMMTREEKKEDHKNAEGNPHHKAKRKALHRQLAARGPARGVQSATCIVVNPTHIAVALRYAPDEADAPYIVAKGREEDALRIRKQAKEQGIPIVKDIPLARTLVHYDVGDEIPEELYKAAAAVLQVALETPDADGSPGRRT